MVIYGEYGVCTLEVRGVVNEMILGHQDASGEGMV